MADIFVASERHVVHFSLKMNVMSDKYRGAQLAEAGTAFRDLRRELKWTQQALSKRSRISRDTIHRFEKGGPIELVSLLALLNSMGYRLTFVPREHVRAEDMRRKFAHIHAESE